MPSPMIGAEGAETETSNGSMLREFADDHSLMLANTWWPSAGYAWTSSKSTRSRIDYVLIPSEIFHGVGHCMPNYDIDLAMNSSCF